MENFERYRFQDFPWLDKDFTQAMEFLKDEKDRELGLYLPNKNIDADMLAELLDLAEENGFMHALMLDRNNIGDDGCQKLCEFLKEDEKLKYLFLENNDITNKGLGLLLEGLKDNTTLKSLWLGRNKIDNDGVAEFSQHLLECKVIKEFSVGGESMTDDGAFCIARALNSNDIITSIHLLDNNVEWDGARLLAEVASRHPACKTIEIDSKNMSASKFSDMMKQMALEEQKKAFEQAVENGEEGPWLRSKIMVVGQGRAGKTATVRSMLNLPFDNNLHSTIGADISTSTTKKTSDNSWEKESTDKKVDLAVDAASRLAVLKMRRKRNEQDEAFKKLTIDEMREHFRQKKEEEQQRIEAQVRAGGNVIPQEVKEEINQKFNATLVTNKNATLEDISFTIWDYGGQKVFYTLHHLFLTKYGIYILAFDMRDVVVPTAERTEEGYRAKKKKQRETREYLEFWLNSVYMHASEAPLLIVGTFLDAVRDSRYILEVNEFIVNILGERYPQVVKNTNLSYFPLSNKEPLMDITALANQTGGTGGVNIDTIRDTIERVARKEDFVNQHLSLRWIKCLDKILDRKVNFLYFKDVVNTGKVCGLRDAEEVENLLKFFHELGMIVHLDSTQNLKEIVTTKPQWLITELSKVIRDKHLHKFDERDLKKRGLLAMYDLARNKSIVTKDWLEYLWPKERVEFLIDLMKRTMLISDWKFGEYGRDVAFLVPSLIDAEDEGATKYAAEVLVQFQEEEEDEEAEIAQLKKEGFFEKTSKGFGRFRIPGRKKRRGKKAREKDDEELIRVMSLEEEMPVVEGNPEAGEAAQEGEEAKEEKEEPPRGYYAKEENVDSIVFDFRKSFLPNGVFQRLLCLCILKCTSDGDVSTEPKLFRSFAEIYMGGKTEDEQVFRLFKYNKQILCKVKKDYLSSYKVLSSMMNKLKADVMGTGLEWDVYLETVDLKDRTDQGVLHSFRPFEEVKEEQISPWFHKESAANEQKMIEQTVGIELEAFLSDISAF